MKKIVCIGDSLTFGYGVNKSNRWTNLIENKLSIKTINKGINGNSTTDMLFRSFEDVIEQHPTHVLIMGGTNDFFMNHSVNLVKDNLITLCTEALQHNIKPIVLIPIPTCSALSKDYWSPHIDYDIVNSKIIYLKNYLLDFCNKNHILLIDLFSPYENELINLKSKNIDNNTLKKNI